jgi:hypothetical protein
VVAEVLECRLTCGVVKAFEHVAEFAIQCILQRPFEPFVDSSPDLVEGLG